MGDLGDGAAAGSSVPVAVEASGVLAGKTLTQLAAGDSHTCTLDSAGAAYCWGENNNGQACTGGSNQQWQLVNGMLVNPISRKCLADPAFSTADGTQLQIYTCNGGANQQWKLP